MSRQHTALVEGSAHVEMVCDVCEKRQWVLVPITECCECPEYRVTRDRSGWQYADDGLVCSEKCATAFWNDDAW